MADSGDGPSGTGRRRRSPDRGSDRPTTGKARNASRHGRQSDRSDDPHAQGAGIPPRVRRTRIMGNQTKGQPLRPVPDATNQRSDQTPRGNRGGDQRRGGRRTTGRPEPDSQATGRLKAEGIKLFFEHCLAHVQGIRAGEPFHLSDWQYRDIILPLFGTLNADGLRRYRTAYVEIPRKNGKSTLAAGIALALLFADGEAGAEIVSAAADREQASIVFDLASRMVQNNPVLSSRCQVLRKEIITRRGCRYRALSADAYTKHGDRKSTRLNSSH